MVINIYITEKHLTRVNERIVKDGGLRTQRVELPDYVDLTEQVTRKSKEVITVLKGHRVV